MRYTRFAILASILSFGWTLSVHAQPATGLPALTPDAAPDRNKVRASEVPLTKLIENDKYECSAHEIILDNGLRRFGLRKADERWKGGVVVQHVGWDIPDEGNWYHSSMFDLIINGNTVNITASTFKILESGNRGVVDFTLDNQVGKFRCRFMVIPGSEVLFADFYVEPVGTVSSLVLKLHNYPGSYQATREGKRHRQVFNVSGALETQTQPYSLDPVTNWWYFYQDAIFDKATPEYAARAYGPSALVLPTNEAKQVKITVGDYEVPTEIEYNPDRRHFRLAFLDYFGMGNKAAQDRFAKERDAVRATLDGLDFVPQRLRQAQATLSQISAKDLSGEVAAAVPELKRLLTDLPKSESWVQKPVSSEDRTLQLLDQYDKARWVTVKKQRLGIGVLVMRGLHWRYWGIDKALHELSGKVRESAISHYSEYYWKGEDLAYFPATWEEMSRFDVIVFANVPFTVLGSERSKALAEFIQAGGSVLLLGGTHAYGQGGIDKPPLGPLMPVQSTKVFDVQQFDKLQPMIKTKDAPSWLIAGLNWKAAPSVIWYQQVNPSPSGNVWLTAGGKPFLISGSASAGRIAALCAPPYGEPPKGTTAFWQWSSWPKLMSRLLFWLGRGEIPPTTP